MLNVYRRHRRACPKFGARTQECNSKPKCPIHFEGVDGVGIRRKPQAVRDPQSESRVRDWNRAVEIIRDLELPRPAPVIAKAVVSLQSAIRDFLASKAKKDGETQRKYRNLLLRLQSFSETVLNKSAVSELSYPDVIAFRNTWQEAGTTQTNQQTMLKAFFTFCVDADYISRSPARKLDPIPEDREKTDPFTSEETEKIFKALPRLEDEYGRCGGAIAKQTIAFVYVMRYTGMSIGDTTTLEKEHVSGQRIRTYRKKTGEDVYGKVPLFVIEALNQAPHDSAKYFFWSGVGNSKTRTSKWGQRLQRLFVLARVKVRTVEKRRRSGGRLKDTAEVVTVSAAKPHMFRHTLARDLLLLGMPLEELAEVLGNSPRIIERYYSKWDIRRQARLEEHLTGFWNDDALTRTLTNARDQSPPSL